MATHIKKPITEEKVKAEMYSQEDPAPIVNYTAGMIITFVILLLVAIFVLSILYFRQ